MKVVAETELFSYYQTEISVFRNRYRYYFEFIDMNNQVFKYNERGFVNENFQYNDMNSFQFPYIAEEDLYTDFFPNGFDTDDVIYYLWQEDREDNYQGRFNFYLHISRNKINQ